LAIFVKPRANTNGFWVKILFFKARQNSYTGLSGTTNPEYGCHGRKIRSFS
jgi:hypothetical protein